MNERIEEDDDINDISLTPEQEELINEIEDGEDLIKTQEEADEIEANAKVEEEVSAIKLEEEAWLKEFERKINRGKGRERGE